jgi:hypothetical protein
MLNQTQHERTGITNLGNGNMLQDLPLLPMFYIHLPFEITSMHAYTAPLFHCYALGVLDSFTSFKVLFR